MDKFDHRKIEKKWQSIWEDAKIYQTDLLLDKPKHYNLVMFPYPSGEYLHIGHGYSYSGADVYARYKKLKGFNIFEPIGYDSFGLPAENYAIKKGVHPKESTKDNIKHAEKQLKAWGCAFDWFKKVIASDPDYYKWTQWLFLKMYEKGLAYQKESPVNWCPKCLTVLANEQVINNLCERCDTEVVQKNMKQWFFKITDYADRLIEDLDKVDWAESSKIKQKNWIGKSVGTEIDFKGVILLKENGELKRREYDIPVFTTRPDTLFGVTYMVLAPEHPLALELTLSDRKKEVEKYIEKSKKRTELERAEAKDKTGVFTGATTVNPVTGEQIPIWISDYVLLNYGTGAVMAVPAHDQRDYEFAEKYGLEIKEVINPVTQKERIAVFTKAYEEPGILINSDEFNGMSSEDAKVYITDFLISKNSGRRVTNYKLRDWSFSRQRYWGAPIPVIYCKKCGTVPVSEKDLPVVLPDLDIKDVRPKGTGKGPLSNISNFVNTKCPKCKGNAERETDTIDTFVDSSFYFLRYPSVGDSKEMMNPEITKKWLPVDMYVGGAEHITMHFLYARFITKALYDMGLINFDEPFLRVRHQGMILGPDGKKMSKSKGNVVIPDEVIKEEGADSFRAYILFMGPFEEGGPWNPKGIKGVRRFLERYWNLAVEVSKEQKPDNPEDIIYSSKEIEETALNRIINKTIKKVGEDIENFKFNTAISSLMECINETYSIKENLPIKESSVFWNEIILKLTIIIHPFAPHITEEAWHKLGRERSIFYESWPLFDEEIIKEDIVTIAVQVNGKFRGTIEVAFNTTKDEVEQMAKEVFSVKKYVEGKKIKKSIFVLNKLINLIIE